MGLDSEALERATVGQPLCDELTGKVVHQPYQELRHSYAVPVTGVCALIFTSLHLMTNVASTPPTSPNSQQNTKLEFRPGSCNRCSLEPRSHQAGLDPEYCSSTVAHVHTQYLSNDKYRNKK